MIVLYSPVQARHDPSYQLVQGVRLPYPERPDRVEALLAALSDPPFEVVAPDAYPIECLYGVHSEEYVAFLRDVSERARGMVDEVVCASTDSPHFGDEYVGIGIGTFESAIASANTTLTAAALLAGGERAVYALCRPPGHHAGQDYCGGFCFLNNAALAADALVRGGAKVSILDIDYHHGNGTQDIFYESSAVQFVSIHSDPADEYPYRAGFADETGCGPGLGANLNLPLVRKAPWPEYLGAFGRALDAILSFQPGALIVSFGADILRSDPEGYFDFGPEALEPMAHSIAQLGLRTLIVQEGGYDVAVLGGAVTEFLRPFGG